MSRVYRVRNGTQKMIDCRKVAKHYGYMIKPHDIKEGYRVYRVINKQTKETLLEGDLSYMYDKLWRKSEYSETMEENLKLLEQSK